MRKPALPPLQRGGMDPNSPEPGYWMIRMGRGCPPMPASISRTWYEPGSNDTNLLRAPVLIANIGRKDADPYKVWTARRERVLTKPEYEFEMERVTWVRDYAPEEPEAQPDKRVDLTAIPPVGPK